jgi:hypothetical protein
MHALLLTAALLTQVQPLELGDDRAKLQGLTDGQGHLILYNAESPYSGPLLAGDGTTFHQVRVFGGGASGTERWDVSFWDPRVVNTGNGRASLSMADSGAKYTLYCGKKDLLLTRLPDEELAKVLASAKLFTGRWTRLPEKLIRDDEGHYFFIDRLRTEDATDRRDFRVFMGSRGKMKQLPLKDIVDDSEGTIFATRDGVLRLITTDRRSRQQTFKWVVGKKETALTEVPIEDNVKMVYVDLGPYSGLPLGTPCDHTF